MIATAHSYGSRKHNWWVKITEPSKPIVKALESRNGRIRWFKSYIAAQRAAFKFNADNPEE